MKSKAVVLFLSLSLAGTLSACFGGAESSGDGDGEDVVVPTAPDTEDAETQEEEKEESQGGEEGETGDDQSYVPGPHIWLT